MALQGRIIGHDTKYTKPPDPNPGHGTKYTKPPDPNPRSRRQIYQLWYLFATTLSASLQSLCYNPGKNRSKVPSRKVTMHCPAPHCDSLKVRPMATSERKRVYWQLKTGLRRVHILQNKKKIIPISAVDNKKKKDFIKLQSYRWRQKSAGVTYYDLRRRLDKG